jgi:hypothetical protein
MTPASLGPHDRISSVDLSVQLPGRDGDPQEQRTDEDALSDPPEGGVQGLGDHEPGEASNGYKRDTSGESGMGNPVRVVPPLSRQQEHRCDRGGEPGDACHVVEEAGCGVSLAAKVAWQRQSMNDRDQAEVPDECRSEIRRPEDARERPSESNEKHSEHDEVEVLDDRALGWSPDQYEQWLGDLLDLELLEPHAP